MPKLIISINDEVVKEAPLNLERATIGRRPYNDIVLDDRTVSGDHAVIRSEHGGMTIEDLASTNGTFVNGARIHQQALTRDALIGIGKYEIRYVRDESFEVPSDTGLDRMSPLPVPEEQARSVPKIRVLNGPSEGHAMALTRPVMTLGKRGSSVASITRKAHGFELAHVEGDVVPMVNGVSISEGSIILHNRDRIVIGTTELEYLES